MPFSTKFVKKLILAAVVGSAVTGSTAYADSHSNDGYVPLRSAVESKGGKIEWDGPNRTVKFTLGNGLTGSVKIGATEYELGGLTGKLPGEIILKNDKTYIPKVLADVLKDDGITKLQLHQKGLEFSVIATHGDKLMDGNTYGDNNDFSGYIPINGSEEGWLLSSHETRPGGASLFHVKKGADGFYQVIDSKKVNFDAVGGTWNNCSGNVTPWGTFLSGEEYEPPKADDKRFQEAVAKAKEEGTTFSEDYLNFGYIVEINPNTLEVKKHKAMGRFSHEAAIIMPDKKTAYMTDDARGGIFAKFVADKEGDLSSGKLYVYKKDTQEWLLVPEEHLTDVRAWAASQGAANFGRPEDIEYNPVDGMVYWAETEDPNRENQRGRIYQFNPKTNELKVFVEGQADTFANPDGMAINPVTGDIYVHEDNYEENMLPTIGQDNNAVWKISLKDKSVTKVVSGPFGSELTGGYFTSDGKVMFLNIQHPSAPNKDFLVQIKGFKK